MKKCVITVVGKDTVGIIARVCTYLAIGVHLAKLNTIDIMHIGIIFSHDLQHYIYY